MASAFGQRPARQPWPPRARRLIEQACTSCIDWLEAPLQRCLDAFDQSLYQQAEHSRNHLEQQRCFDSQALLEKQRARFVRSFLDGLHDRFARIDEPDDDHADSRPATLSLLDRNEHELVTALDKLAARAEAHNSLVLSELGYRMAVLVARPPLEGADLPPGPASLAQVLRIASDPLELPVEHRLLLLQSFEFAVCGTIDKLYETLNGQLLKDGILPQLRAFAAARPSLPPHAAPAATPAAPAQEPATAAANATPDEPIAVLETLRDLLARHRNGTVAEAGRAATSEELQTALSALQQHLAQVAGKASRELRSAQRLREELLIQLNAGKPPGAARTSLSEEQDDTVELVAMLFEQLGEQLHHGPHAQALLGDLQVPMLRLAMTDHDFFDQREHPGRRLLGTVAEAAGDWLDGPGGETDRPLLTRLEQLIERARREPPSAGLYTTLLADIEHHLAQLNRKAQTTERRHVEAMQGREKLDQARRRAAELMDERFARAQPRGLLRALLERAWSDVLALTLLRHDEDSDAFRQRMEITDQLLGLCPMNDAAALQQDVEAGLQQIGMHAEEAAQVAQRLIGTGVPAPSSAPPTLPTGMPAQTAVPRRPQAAASPAPAAAPRAGPPSRPADDGHLPSATDLALRLKQRQRLGEQRGQESRVDAMDEPPLGPQEARVHNRLRQLPFGTWFEFADPAGNRTGTYKLAWFSPVSGNSLFVNRRGQRGEEMNLRQLARAMVAGHVRELPPQRDGLLDRAWHSLTTHLLRPSRTGGRP